MIGKKCISVLSEAGKTECSCYTAYLSSASLMWILGAKPGNENTLSKNGARRVHCSLFPFFVRRVGRYHAINVFLLCLRAGKRRVSTLQLTFSLPLTPIKKHQIPSQLSNSTGTVGLSSILAVPQSPRGKDPCLPPTRHPGR